VLISEAEFFSDVFVFQLMFRLYRIPRTIGDLKKSGAESMKSDVFGQQKKMLTHFSRRTTTFKFRGDGKSIDYVQFLLISALPLNVPDGKCAALKENKCSIYDRRPVSCRSVPIHYSRPSALAESDLANFVSRPGFQCNISIDADLLVQDGEILDPNIVKARGDAKEMAIAEQSWGEAIIRRMKHSGAARSEIPTLQQIEENASIGAMTTSMRIGWEIAAEAGLISQERLAELLTNQLDVIERFLVFPISNKDESIMLREMRQEYQMALTSIFQF
jgi:Fe-S-cluster containining protein